MNFHITPTGWILLSAALVIVALFIFVLLFFQLRKKPEPVIQQPENKPQWVITSQDIKAIAGDDVMVTKLDLARAYIELGKKKLAQQILSHVSEHGNESQQQAAKQLMSTL